MFRTKSLWKIAGESLIGFAAAVVVELVNRKLEDRGIDIIEKLEEKLGEEKCEESSQS